MVAIAFSILRERHAGRTNERLAADRAVPEDARRIDRAVDDGRRSAAGAASAIDDQLDAFAELGAQIKERSVAANTVFSGFSNGHYAYLPTTIAYEEGGYEVRVTPFAPGSEQLAVDACLEAVERVCQA